ncbi:hypothetical protein [Legionella sp.]|uniref:hypothetical protein n=1 Tax=Legionella sp. TaxID=459 RepID=UPI003C83E367
MDSYGNNQFGFMSQQKKFFKTFAKEYLAFLGNAKLSAKHVSEMQNVLSHVFFWQYVIKKLILHFYSQNVTLLAIPTSGRLEHESAKRIFTC